MWFDKETGQLDRPNGPAITDYFQVDGRTRRGETFYQQGIVRREGDLPSSVAIDVETGIELFREWTSTDGSVSRLEGKPAVITTDLETGVVIKEQYWEHGKPHRLGGPADIERDRSTGKVTSARFFERGKEIAAPEHPGHKPPQP